MGTVPAPALIPAAQYLRVSTDRQEYSIENQMLAIKKYAESRGFTVVQTYSDPAISGVLLRKRKALQNLIQDVVRGGVSYRAILVYDVSRWGRFQDTDEAAHYEFVCKSSGAPVHYCAETFANDGNMASLIMKSLKRAMAGEYSRELGIKVAAGQQRGAMLGFRQGGQPGYGLRRLLVSADGTAKQILRDGERKSIFTDRIILVPGPDQEVKNVQEIYRLFIRKHFSFTEIARQLNRRGFSYLEGSKWSCRAVQKVLTHPKYIGCNVWGQQTQKLYTNPVWKPKSEWTFKPRAFKPLVDEASFETVQQIIAARDAALPRHKSDEELLDTLRAIRAKHGTITMPLIRRASKAHSIRTYFDRFGTVTHAYELIGFHGFWTDGWIETRRRILKLRDELMQQIVSLNSEQVLIEKNGESRRRLLRLRDGRRISVVVSRHFQGYKDAPRWFVRSRPTEYSLITLLARLNTKSDGFLDLHVIPPERKNGSYILSESDSRLRVGMKLLSLLDFREAVEQVAKTGAVFG